MKLIRKLSTSALVAALAFGAASTAGAQVRDTTMMRQDTMMMQQDSMMMRQDSMMMRRNQMMQDSMRMQGQMMQDSMQMQGQQMQDSMQMRQGQMMQGQQMQQGQASGMAMGSQTVVGIAQSSPDFETLTQAVQAAGLAGTLNGPGPFTVFAPTDAAFDKVPQATLDGLMSNPSQLRSVLTYHVVSGELTPADLQGRSSVETLNGARLSVRVEGGNVYVGNAQVVAQADASNGLVYGIDSLLMPPERMTK